MHINKNNYAFTFIFYTLLYIFVYYLSQVELARGCGFICLKMLPISFYHIGYLIVATIYSILFFKKIKDKLFSFTLCILIFLFIFVAAEKIKYENYKKESALFTQKRIDIIEKEKSNALATYNFAQLAQPRIMYESVSASAFVMAKLRIPFSHIKNSIDGRSLIYQYRIVADPILHSSLGQECVVFSHEKYFTLNTIDTDRFVQRLHINPGDQNNIINSSNYDQYYLEHIVFIEHPWGENRSSDCLSPEIYQQLTPDDFVVKQLTIAELTREFNDKVYRIKLDDSLLTFVEYINQRYR